MNSPPRTSVWVKASPAKAGAATGMRGGHGGKHGGGMMMGMADANKDGAVSRDEFLAGHAKHFDMADANKDGKLSPEERKAAHEKMREHMSGMMGKGHMGGMHGGHDARRRPRRVADPAPGGPDRA